MRAKFIYEKFTADSDPIKDMGIGNPEKSIFPILQKELDKYDISIEWDEYEDAGEGVWEISFYIDNDDNYDQFELIYGTDEAAVRSNTAEEPQDAGFSDPYEGNILKKSTYDIDIVVESVLKRVYGNKTEISQEIKKLEQKINKLKNIQKIV